MKSKLIPATLAAGITLCSIINSEQALAQLQEDFQQKNPPTTEEQVDNTIDDIRSFVEWNIKVRKDLAEKVYGYICDKRLELAVERQLEEQLHYDFGDTVVEEYLSRNKIIPKIDADIKGFTEGKKSAIVEVDYKLGVDKSKIVRQYEVSLEGNSVTGILDVGKTYAKRYGMEMTVPELYSLIKLRKCVEDRWNLSRMEEELKGQYTLDYELTPEAFAAFESFIDDKYRASRDGLVIPNDMGRAQVGIRYTLTDKYDNIANDVTFYVVEQYINPKRKGKWLFDEVIAKTHWKQGMLIGTEESKFDKRSFFENLKKRGKEMLKDVFR